MTTALVLGAGGAAGWVFHVAVLKTLSEAGIEPMSSEVIVGTSAGSALGVALRSGVDLDEFKSRATRPPTEEDRRAMMSELRKAKKSLIPLAPTMVRELRPRGAGASLAFAGLLPPGLFPTGWVSSLPGLDRVDGWPANLWIPAVRIPDGDRVVFGRDRTDVPVSVAVEASSAVPGMFRPKKIGEETFVDGGVMSSTHADLVLGSGVDRVVISAPMSRRSGGPFARNAKKRLTEELEALQSAGIESIVVEPTDESVSAAKGYPRRRPDAAQSIAAHARRAAITAIANI